MEFSERQQFNQQVPTDAGFDVSTEGVSLQLGSVRSVGASLNIRNRVRNHDIDLPRHSKAPGLDEIRTWQTQQEKLTSGGLRTRRSRWRPTWWRSSCRGSTTNSPTRFPGRGGCGRESREPGHGCALTPVACRVTGRGSNFPESSGKIACSAEGGATSGAVAADPDLTRILAAWPILPEPIRRAMLALIETAVPVASETP
jgi:hypothetical protein